MNSQNPTNNRIGFAVSQCKAIQGCPKAVVDTSLVAESIARVVEEMKLDEIIRHKFGERIANHHVFDIVFSGCPNGCSKPQINDLAIMARSIVEVNLDQCISCMRCLNVCKEDAIDFIDQKIVINQDHCVGCDECVRVCPTSAIENLDTGYRILVGGKLGRHPQLAVEAVPFVKGEEVEDIVRQIITYFKEYSLKHERFGDLIKRTGIEALQEYLSVR
ncbi:hypothetical protein BHU72_06080 [Desulfuribacillus stibiiarsenatis]|uniref:4Fe-4S ferredoxin-type domain-containing protein n=1 Tax=Desulfuribacillus stibiiarsenatis TaxID=1390249 RepID=A0A1E5L4Z0_9FIRM|nr:4Fe-4S binding protein [Desulfuribacillus stibiiarsenatis]OEH85176.1 hypothetical protein BHU72_06080 [Desulfuribacillus stibiiarsenatis]